MSQKKSLLSKLLLSAGLPIAGVFTIVAGTTLYMVNQNADQSSLVLIFGFGLAAIVGVFALAVNGISKKLSGLNEIVDGIGKVTDQVGNIAEASNEQATGIALINAGIDQVAQVVQHNSATSEKSAAANEELSSQAEMLKQMINQFQLKRR